MSTSDRAICPLCEATCGLVISHEGPPLRGGRISDVRGNASDVFSRGYLCPKGFALKALEEDPDRLRTPLIRSGTQWREATWDQAFEEIAAGLPPLLNAHGRESVALYLGNPNVHNLAGQLYVPVLARALMSRNIYSASSLVEVELEVTDSIMPGVVSLPHGWGHQSDQTRLSVARQRPGVNVNRLLSDLALEPLSGTAIQNSVAVSLSPVV